MYNNLVRQSWLSAMILSISVNFVPARGQTTPPPDDADLRKEVEALKARVEAQDREIASLRFKNDDTWLTEQRAEQIRGLVQDVLADADTRASLLAEGITAGHDGKNFFLASADGNYRMNISGIMQVRYIANSRDEALDDDVETGLQLRRIKVKFDGNIISPKFMYAVQLAANRDTGAVEVDLATIGYRLTDDIRVDAGRYKDPFLREEFTPASRQLAVERSLVNAIYTANYVEGVKFEAGVGERTRLYLSLNDGVRSGDPGGIGNDFASDMTDFAVTARADLMLAGDWKQYADFSAWSGEEFAAFVGAAMHYEIAETGDAQTASPGVDSFITYTVDGSLETSGFNAYGALIGRQVDLVAGAPTSNFNDFGALVQAGYMLVPDKLEPYIRYEWISPDDDRGFDEMNLITIGGNYYFNKHSAKFTADLIWALDELNGFAFSSPTSRTGLGLLPDSPGQSDQIVLRMQFQLLF
jgi:hypothetical protein